VNYRIPPHWHPVKVTVTVMSGTFHMGFGDELDTGKGKTLPAGSIFEMPAKIHHFGWTSEETIIQEHGVGPLTTWAQGTTPGGHRKRTTASRPVGRALRRRRRCLSRLLTFQPLEGLRLTPGVLKGVRSCRARSRLDRLPRPPAWL